MKKSIVFIISILLLFSFIKPSPAKAAENVVQITQAASISDDGIYLLKDTTETKNYSGFKNQQIRIFYSSDTEIETTISSYYVSIVEQNMIDGYIDLLLLEEGECLLVVEIKDSSTNESISYDYLNIRIYDEVESIDLSTISTLAYKDKILTLDVVINNDLNLYLKDIYFYYLDEFERKVIIQETITTNNQFVFVIDEAMAQNQQISIYAQWEEVTSSAVTFDIENVSYLTYFDLVETEVKYSLNDELSYFYIRIPLDSTPDFTILDESGAITVIKYEITENFPTYSLVCVEMRLNKAIDNQIILVGGLMDESKDYIYKELKISIIDSIQSINILYDKLDVDFGSINTFNIVINDEIYDVICNAEWYVNENLVSKGSTLNYQFFDSGYQYITLRYQDYEANIRVYVGYSNQTTVLWYVALFGLIIFGLPLLLVILSRKNKKIAILNKKTNVFFEKMKTVKHDTPKYEFTKMNMMLHRIVSIYVELSEEVDNTFLDRANTEMKKLENTFKKLPDLEEKRFDEMLDLVQKRIDSVMGVLKSAESLEKKQLSKKGGN